MRKATLPPDDLTYTGGPHSPAKRREKAAPKPSDPASVNARLYNQVDKLLDDMEAADRDETMTFPQRINAMIAIGRIMKMFADLRKSEISYGAGSAVTRYAAAFAAPNAIGGRTANSGTVVELDRPEPGDPDYDGDDAA